MDDKTWELLIDRLEGIEGKIKNLDKKMSSIMQFKWWVMGAAAALSVGSSTIIGQFNEAEGIGDSEINFAIPASPSSILLDKQDTGYLRPADQEMATKRNEKRSRGYFRGSTLGPITSNRGKDPNG